jgi:hypothetical protein
MKNIARISRDNHSQLSDDIWNEDLNEHIQSLDVFIDTRNRQFSYDAIRNQRRELDEFDNTNNGDAQCIIVEAKGYVQSEWESFEVYYKCSDKEVNPLIEHLKKTFTHRNDYLVENVEELITGHTKVVERCVVNVNDPEFPELQDIVKVIEEMQNGVKVYDEYKLIE